MKLIATLATLAALVGQTEATASATAVEVFSVKVGNAPCTDEIVLKATGSTVVAATKKLSFSSSKLSTEKTATGDLQVLSSTATLCAGADAEAILTTVAATEASGVTTWEWTVATGQSCATGDLTVTLKNVCNNGLVDYSGLGHALKYKADADDVEASEQAAAVGSTAAVGHEVTNNPAELADFTINALPVEKSQEGAFNATWTGVAALNDKKLVLNLPTGYTIPQGAICKIKTEDEDAKVITAASDGGLAAECTNTCLFDQAVTTLVNAKLTTLTCDKVKAGATVPAPATASVSVKAHSTTNQNSLVAYSKPSKTAAPSKSPTAKPDDSPASVATASGVVVGALGVAALFLA